MIVDEGDSDVIMKDDSGRVMNEGDSDVMMNEVIVK